MPSFVCDRCQETLKKAKLDSHKQYCRQSSFSCIDCYKSFKGDDYRAHTSCITEVQKYHGKPTAKNDFKKQQPVVEKPKDETKEESASKKQKVENDKLMALLKTALKEPKALKELKKIADEKDLKKEFEKRLQFSIDESGNISVTLSE